MADWNGFKKNGTTYIPNDATARASISTIEGKIPSAASSSNKLVDTSTLTTELNGKVNVSSVGANNGVAGLDANGRVPSSQLPSYVDDVLEYASQSAFPATGETGKIYIALDTNKTYRWSGSAYVEISESLALGETSSTAYAGNKGKANADAIEAMKDGSSIDSFGDVETALAGKVDKVQGKGLSTNDYDNTAKAVVTTAQDNIKANTKLISDTVGWSGKNKWVTDLFTDKTVTGVRAVVNSDKSITVTGSNTGSGNNVFECGEIVLKAGDYKLSGAIGGSENTISLQIYKDSSNMWYDVGNGVDISLNADSTLKLRVYFKAGLSNVNVTFFPMLHDADILDDTYEPYFGSTAFPRSEQAVLGAKNLLPNNLASGTNNGVTYTVNDDLSVTLNGTATANTDLFIYGTWLSRNNNIYKKGIPYRVSMKSSKNSGYHAYVQTFVNGSAGTTYVNSGTEGNFTIASDSEDGIRVMLVVENGATFNNDTIYPMIKLASDPDDTYVLPAMTNRELTEMLDNSGTYDLYMIANAVTSSNGTQPEFFIPWNNPKLKTPTFSFTIRIRNNSAWETLEQSGAINIQKVCKNGFLVNAVLTNALTTNSQFTFRIDGTITF